MGLFVLILAFPIMLVPIAAAASDVPVGLGGNEPHAAVVNPLNPHNVVVSQGGQLRISTDFGATFPTLVNAVLPPGLPAGYGIDGDDVIAFDAQGRLFWSYLIVLDVNGNNQIELPTDDISVAVQQVNPTTGARIGNAVDVTPGNHSDDKEWITADANPASPFANNIYLHWTRFDNNPREEMFSRSINQGATFSNPAIIATG